VAIQLLRQRGKSLAGYLFEIVIKRKKILKKCSHAIGLDCFVAILLAMTINKIIYPREFRVSHKTIA